MYRIAKLFLLLFLSLFLNFSDSFGQNAINIDELGAKGNGNFLNTSFIQKAIDQVSSQGGGQVIVPAGTFRTGAITLKSGVNLHLEFNAVLLGSKNPNHYVSDGKLMGFINANNAKKISITGEGTLNNRGRSLALNIDSLFHAGKWKEPNYNYRRNRSNRRPSLLRIEKSDGIEVRGITVKDAAFWVLNFELCNNLIIDDVTIDSDAYWNNDGIDIVDCQNVRITNTHVNSADDGICLKSENKGHMTSDVYIANSTVRSSASAIKFGTASTGGFKNVKIENVNVYDTYRSAIALESVDGGVLKNVEISDITAINTGNAIFIRLGHRNKDSRVGTVENISIENVFVQVPFEKPDLQYQIRGPKLSFFHNVFPASITGIPGHNVKNVSLKDIRITYPGRANKGYAYLPISRLDSIPENKADYPEFDMFGELPAWGFYVRHVDGLTMQDLRLEVRESDFRPAFVFDDVDDLDLNKIYINPTNRKPQIILKNVEDHSIMKVDIQGIEGKGVMNI